MKDNFFGMYTLRDTDYAATWEAAGLNYDPRDTYYKEEKCKTSKRKCVSEGGCTDHVGELMLTTYKCSGCGIPVIMFNGRWVEDKR